MAWLYCLDRMEDVTPDQNLRDSFDSWTSSGGTDLGTIVRGTRSIRSWGLLDSEEEVVEERDEIEDPLPEVVAEVRV